MMLAITKRARTLLFFLSASSYTAWFSGLGERIAAQGAAGYTGSEASERGTNAGSISFPTIVRDPFARASDPDTTGRSTQTIRESMIVPDIAIDRIGRVDRVQLVVRATIVGQNPVAYIDDRGTMDIVAVGDALAGERVAHIDLRGVSFTNGDRLELPDVEHTPPPAVASGNTIFVRLADLRRLLTAKQATPLPSSPVQPNGAAITTNATQTATPAVHGPRPLRTADSRGLTVGTNPSPDPSDVTAQPYAPPR
jgi:hypothetical protein